jgi:hypothetical protein
VQATMISKSTGDLRDINCVPWLILRGCVAYTGPAR